MNKTQTQIQENKLLRIAEDVMDLKVDTEKTVAKKIQEIDSTIEEAKNIISIGAKLNKEIQVNFEELANETVEVIKEIKTGPKGEDADEKAMEARITAKIPSKKDLIKEVRESITVPTIQEILAQIPENKPSLKIIQESIDIDQVVEEVNKKLDEKPFEISKINGLSGKLDNITRDIARKTGYSGGGDTVAAGTNITITTNSNGNKVISSTGGTGGTPYAETPSGTVDGSNTVFTLAHTPDDSASVKVFLDGIAQYNGVDYSVSGTTITFVAAPASGSTIFAYYNDNSAGTSSSITLQTDGVANGSQTLLNLQSGTGITLTDNGSGTVTIDSTGGVETWAAATAYSANQLVTFGTRLLRRTTAGTSNGAFDNTEAATWTLISNDTVGTFIATNYYYASEKILDSGSLWQRNTSGISGATFDATEKLQWTQIATDTTTIPDWAAATDYIANQPVKFGTRTLRRIADGTSNGAFTNGEAADWTLISNPVATVWAPSNYEYQGELFTVGTRIVIRTAADGVSGLTFDATESDNYEVVEKLLLASFQPNTLYYSNEKFTENGVMYRRFNTGMSGATFDAAEQVEWRVDGNDNNPIGSTTSTRTAANVTVGYDDGELLLQPAGSTMNVTLNSTLPDGKEFGMNGIVDSTKVITWTAGAGTTIQDPVTNLPVASFNNSTWIDTAPFSFQVIKVSNIWRLRGM